MFFASLASSIVDNVENENNSDDNDVIILEIIKHMNRFGFTNKFLAASFYEICLKQKKNTKVFSHLECQSIVKNCKNLNLEPLGIQMLLKKPRNSETVEPSSSKKARKTVQNNKKEMPQEDLLGMYFMSLFRNKNYLANNIFHIFALNFFLGLIELYKNIGDDSSARGVLLEFKNEINSDIFKAIRYSKVFHEKIII